jgi:hypothetical protein
LKGFPNTLAILGIVVLVSSIAINQVIEEALAFSSFQSHKGVCDHRTVLVQEARIDNVRNIFTLHKGLFQFSQSTTTRRTYGGPSHVGNSWVLTFGFDFIVYRFGVHTSNFQDLNAPGNNKVRNTRWGDRHNNQKQIHIMTTAVVLWLNISLVDYRFQLRKSSPDVVPSARHETQGKWD